MTDDFEVEMGGFYTCSDGVHPPVIIWIGSVDLPQDLKRGASEPVISLIVKSTEPDMPTISHAPFLESVVFDSELGLAEPFDLTGSTFAKNYKIWREAYENDAAEAWAISPAEAYAGMMISFRKGLEQ